MDWKAGLQAFINNNPDLPQGEEPAQPAPSPAKPGKLNVLIERKGHKGKTVTIIEGFNASDDRVASIASQLKQALGTGGSSRGGEILIQGNRLDDVKRWLKDKGLI